MADFYVRGEVVLSDECFIYGLRAKDSSRYFYVGSTKLGVAERWDGHRRGLASNRNQHFVRTVQAIGVDNVVAVALEKVPASRRFERESHWINSLPGLTNLVKNPTALALGPTVYTTKDVEAVLARVRQLPGEIPRLVCECVEASLKALRAIDCEQERREQTAI